MQPIRVPANGITFEVFTAGTGNRVALCLHGFPECAYSWRFQVPLLTELGYRVWVPNLRGYGNTTSPPGIASYAIDILIADIAALIQASPATELLLIAHDWGAVLAWYLAMQQPQLIHRLVICNVPHPACFLRELRRPPQLLRSWYVLFFQLPVLPELLCKLIFKLAKNIPAPYRENASRPGGLRAMLNWYRALLQTPSGRKLQSTTYPLIQTPTLFIWGAADTALDLRTTYGTSNYVSNLDLHILPGISHWVQQEAPDDVNQILKAWLTIQAT